VDSLLKALTAVVPFMGRCPMWFQLMVLSWLALTAVVAITGFALAIFEPPSAPQIPPVPSVSAPSSAPLSQPQSESQLKIIEPKAGSLVDIGDTVLFVSPYSNLNHYVIVTPLRSPTRWVVDGPLRVEAGVQQHGKARFGDTQAGQGERFSIQILATATLHNAGPLEPLPPDQRLSPAVLVTRAR